MSPNNHENGSCDSTLLAETVKYQDVAKEFDEWIAQHTKDRELTDHPIPSGAADNIRARRRELKNLYSAASVPVSAAVYGASQSGKSLFIGRLLESTDKEGSVLGVEGENNTPAGLDFLRDLNPRETVEATAVVTRFSLNNDRFDQNLIADYAVAGKILTRGDIIKSLARGFKGECVATKIWSEETIEALLKDELCESYAAEKVDADWRLDICEAHSFLVQEYRDRNITASEDALATLLYRYPLTDKGYTELCGHIFWDSWPMMNNLFKKLLELRDKIAAESDFIYMDWAAVPYILNSLAPDKFEGTTCLPATKWTDFGIRKKDTQYVLGKFTNGGRDLRLLQGLICELIVPLSRNNLSPEALALFEVADLLDIPGAVQDSGRSRKTYDEVEVIGNNVSQFFEYEILKRGRVGYLFEKYAEEKQISTLLYMQKWGTFQARSEIGPQLKKWGRSICGKAWPKSLSAADIQASPLYVIMTQIDKEKFWGSSPSTAKFDAVINVELATRLQDFMMHYGGDSKPFTNVSLLRHPGKTDDVKPFTSSASEEGWKKAFLETTAVQKHVGHPEVSWDNAFSPDGGMKHLLSRITSSINGELYRERLRTELKEQASALKSEMQSLYIDVSEAAEIERIKKVSEVIVDWLRTDSSGWRSKHFHDFINCDPALIEGALSDECPQDRLDSLVPQNTDYKKVVSNVLNKWRTSRKWEDMLKLCGDGNGLESEFISYARYLKDYLYRCHLSKIAHALRNLDEDLVDKPKQHRFKEYASSIFDDFIVTPGPREPEDKNEYEEECYAYSIAVGQRYKRILEDRLMQSLGDDVRNPPPGNDTLWELISK